MTSTTRRAAYRRVQYVAARELQPGDIVCSDDGPWKVANVVVNELRDRVTLRSHTGWTFSTPSETRFKRKVINAEVRPT